MTRLVGTLISLLILCWSSAYEQQPVDPNVYHTMKSRHVGPFRGGRVTAVTGMSGRIHSFFSGVAGGGEIAHLVDAGLSPMQAIQSATLRPAQMKGVDDRLGTIAVGKLADIIVVDGNPLDDISLLQYRVSRVIKGGVVYK